MNKVAIISVALFDSCALYLRVPDPLKLYSVVWKSFEESDVYIRFVCKMGQDQSGYRRYPSTPEERLPLLDKKPKKEEDRAPSNIEKFSKAISDKVPPFSKYHGYKRL